MADIKRVGPENPGEIIIPEGVAEFIRKTVTRREFLKTSGALGVGVATFSLLGCGSSDSNVADAPRQVFVANSLGMIVAEPSRCVGCRRCELACSEYNNGVSQPSIARIKVGRNYNLGAVTVNGFFREDGTWGNHRIVQDVCHQCPHPVPCQLACPHGAIEVVPPVNARVVNTDKCQGCGICVKACPWAMTSLTGPVDGATTKSTKCFLCNGNPECVRACPARALTYVAWADMTKSIPPRQVVPASIQLAPDAAKTCNGCH